MIKVTQNELDVMISNHALLHQADVRGEKLDLFNCDLSELNLSDFDLTGARFTDCKMHNTIFHYSTLSYCQFLNCELINSEFNKCNLRLSKFTTCELEGADFSGANLTEVIGIRQYSVDNVGTFGGKITYLVPQDMVYAGCWKGTFKEFELKCKDVIHKSKSYHPNIKNELNATIKFFKSVTNGGIIDERLLYRQRTANEKCNE